MTKEIEKTIELNKKQQAYYNSSSKSKKNLPSRIWSSIRNGLLSNYRRNFNIKDKVYEQHKIWLGDLSDKKVLDLGCLRGNALSIYMAQNAKEYLGIDLSDVAIQQLKDKLDRKAGHNARAEAVDFLSPEFAEKDFDIIYAYGVLHHFEDVDVLINKLKEKMTPNGELIAYDPLDTSTPIRILRAIYRPFQSDAEWEWPFRRSTLRKFNQSFTIKDMKGVLGKSKYGILLSFLPIGAKRKNRMIMRQIESDWNLQKLEDAYKCMHITLYMQNKS